MPMMFARLCLPCAQHVNYLGLEVDCTVDLTNEARIQSTAAVDVHVITLAGL